MKYNNGWILITALLIPLIFFSCKKMDGYNTIVSTDKTKPGQVTNIKVSNFNGGAYITYSLPDSKNILYVLAEYKINDTKGRQTKSSYYSDSITVSGFANSQDYQVTLTTVTRADVKSDPVTVTVHPDTPGYKLTLPTVVMVKDFGGVKITSLNRSRSNIGLIVITPDSTGKLQVISQSYTKLDSLSFSLRGYDTIPRKFGIYITDEFGNISDTVFSTITPIYEAPMDKSKFQEYHLPTDAQTGFGWVMPYMWDGSINSPGYHTAQPILPLVWPATITFDMGKAAKLSRYTIWDRGLDGANYLWDAGAPLTWVLWGRLDQPVDETLPDADHLPPVGQATANGWINLGSFLRPDKPSGLPNPQYTTEDLNFWNAGFGYNLSLDLPKVRYLRFECLQNSSLTNNFFNIMELSFWGDPR